MTVAVIWIIIVQVTLSQLSMLKTGKSRSVPESVTVSQKGREIPFNEVISFYIVNETDWVVGLIVKKATKK